MKPEEKPACENHPLLIDVILTTLFTFHNVTDLMVIRRVCKTWRDASLPRWRSAVIVNVVGDDYFHVGGNDPARIAEIPLDAVKLQELPFRDMRLYCDTLDETPMQQLVSVQIDKVVSLELNRYTFGECIPLPTLLSHASSLRALKLSSMTANSQVQSQLELISPHCNLKRLEICGTGTGTCRWMRYFLDNLLQKLPNLTELRLCKQELGGKNCILKTVFALRGKENMPNIRKLELLDLTPCTSVDVEDFKEAMTLVEKSFEELTVTVLFRNPECPLMATTELLKKLDIHVVPLFEKGDRMEKTKNPIFGLDETRLRARLSYRYRNSTGMEKIRVLEIQISPEVLLELRQGLDSIRRQLHYSNRRNWWNCLPMSAHCNIL